MTEIEIGGKKWPMRATIGAWNRFKETTGKDVADLDNAGNPDLVGFASLAFFFVQAGCKFNGTDFKMSLDDFLDAVEISEMTKIADAIADVMNGGQQKKMTATS